MQQSEQVEDLLRTLKVIKRLSEKNDSIPSQIVQMYLLNEGEMGFTEPSEVITVESNIQSKNAYGMRPSD